MRREDLLNIKFALDLDLLHSPLHTPQNKGSALEKRTLPCRLGLFTNTQLLNQFAVFDNIFFGKVLQQTLSFTYQHQQCTPACVVFTVLVQVLRELLNPISKKCHLALG